MDKNTQEKEKLVTSIVKGFAYAENGGKPNIDNPSAGKSGELKSIFQFKPDTWKSDAKEILGNPNAPLTPDNETYVMLHKVNKWIDQGKTVDEMASIHNSGNPNAYKENHKGVNKYGVKYDTPSYAKKVADYSRQFYKEKNNIDSSGTALTTQSSDMTEPINKLMNTINDAKGNTQNIQDGALNPVVSKKDLSSKLGGLFVGNVKTKASKVKLPKKGQIGVLSGSVSS